MSTRSTNGVGRVRLAIVSTYPPRRCGLATFAADLTGALATAAPDIDVSVCAMDADALSYPPEVATTMAAEDATDYRRAARRLRALGVDVVLIQHEYCIYGGPDGRYVLEFADELRRLGVPYLVTLHTVLSQPTRGQADVLAELCRHAFAVTVFTPTAVRLAKANGLVAHDRLCVVPHGVPDLLISPDRHAPASPLLAEALRSAEGRRVLSTFGLLTPAKGLDTAIRALPAVVERHPSVRYLVAGATHPNHAGEAYADRLREQVDGLGLTDHVTFVEQYLDLPDLAALLARTDVYLTPYRSRDQISSGTLTFAVAAGCPAVSTDYHYAADLLKPGMGALVPPDDSAALAGAVDRLLSDPAALAQARITNRRAGQLWSWPVVAGTIAAAVRGAVPVRRPTSVPTPVAPSCGRPATGVYRRVNEVPQRAYVKADTASRRRVKRPTPR